MGGGVKASKAHAAQALRGCLVQPAVSSTHAEVHGWFRLGADRQRFGQGLIPAVEQPQAGLGCEWRPMVLPMWPSGFLLSDRPSPPCSPRTASVPED